MELPWLSWLAGWLGGWTDTIISIRPLVFTYHVPYNLPRSLMLSTRSSGYKTESISLGASSSLPCRIIFHRVLSRSFAILFKRSLLYPLLFGKYVNSEYVVRLASCRIMENEEQLGKYHICSRTELARLGLSMLQYKFNPFSRKYSCVYHFLMRNFGTDYSLNSRVLSDREVRIFSGYIGLKFKTSIYYSLSFQPKSIA